MNTYGFDFPFRKAWNRLKKSPGVGVRKFLLILAGPYGLSRLANMFGVSSRISRQYSRYYAASRGALTGQIAVIRDRIADLRYRPTISILMPVFNVEETWLRLAIESVREQIYPYWELCVADDASTLAHVRPVLDEYARLDPRIKIVYRQVNGHISAALNTALGLAEGDYVALLDHDDELAPQALYEATLLLEKHPEADLIYTDEDRLEVDGAHVEPYFKPDWSPHLLLSINYITHLAVLRRRIVETIGGFKDEFVGSQDYDLFLRFTEKTDRVFHIPKILYSWRKIPRSAALISDAKPYALDASYRALSEAARRRGLGGEVVQGAYPPFLRIRYRIKGEARAAIVVSFSAEESARRALLSLQALAAGTAGAYEIIAVMGPRLLDQSTRLAKVPGLRLVPAPAGPGSLCENLLSGAAEARSELLAFVNPRAVPLNKDWLSAMIEHAQLPEIGCVGAKLVDKRGRILHAGLALGIRGTAGCPGRGLADVPHLVFYLNLKDSEREVSAVSSDCLMISRTKFAELGGFRNEFRSHYFDVDLCLRLSQRGYTNIYTPHARLRLASDRSDEVSMAGSFEQDGRLLRERWGNDLLSDPFYNPNLTRLGDDLSIGPTAERFIQLPETSRSTAE